MFFVAAAGTGDVPRSSCEMWRCGSGAASLGREAGLDARSLEWTQASSSQIGSSVASRISFDV